METKIYILLKKDERYKKSEVWKFKGAYDSYQEAQQDFIYKNGLFRIESVLLNKFNGCLYKGDSFFIGKEQSNG